MGRHSHPPFLNPLGSLGREACRLQGSAMGVSMAVEVGGLGRKLPWAERGALAPGRGDGSCSLVLPRVPVAARADDTTGTWLP